MRPGPLAFFGRSLGRVATSSSPAEVRKRAFWLHQLAEYVLGVVLVAQGLQSPTPLVPAVAGGVVLANAAVAIGPLGAFRIVGRRLHRVLDIAVIVAVAIAAVQPIVDVELTARLVLGGVAFVLLVVFRQSDFGERAARPPVAADGGRATELGRIAGRLVGDGISAARKRRR